MKKLIIICAFVAGVSVFTACDKVEGPYKVENNTSLGTLPGTLSDIRVLNATTTADDISSLKATFTITETDPKTIEVVLNGMEQVQILFHMLQAAMM